MAAAEWKDISTFSKSDKDRTPCTFEARAGAARLIVTRHVDCQPDEWRIECEAAGIKRVSIHKDLAEAKDELAVTATLAFLAQCNAVSRLIGKP